MRPMHNLVVKLQLSYDTPQLYMFPALSASVKSLSFCLSVPPCLIVPPSPLTVYHCIFLLMRPDSAPIPIQLRTFDTYTPPLKTKKEKKNIPQPRSLSVLRLHSITAGPNFSFQSWNMIIFLFARNINCSRRTYNHWGGKEKLPV